MSKLLKTLREGEDGLLLKHRWLKIVIPILLVLIFSTLTVILMSNRAEAPKHTEVETSNTDTKKDTPQPTAVQPALDINTASSQYVLVNKTHPLNPIDYRPADLVSSVVATSSSDSSDEKSIRELIKPELVQMFTDAKAANLDLIMNSGFRSSKLQSFYYNNYVKNSGQDAANRFSAKPGYSEHQTGLAFDVSYASRKCYLEVCFAETEAGKWLADNAHKYGFILRYPNGKESVTGYQFEPWHFRYVGKEVAKAIYDKSTTYEEYLQELNLITI